MQTSKWIRLSLLCLVLNTWTFSTYAAGWPAFSLPDDNFLIDKQYVKTGSCPPGQGQAIDGTIIDMQGLCKGFCPETWTWTMKSDGQCRELTEFVLQRHEITHYPDDDNGNDGTVLYSEINVFYGKKDAHPHALQLVFTAPKEHWYCVQLEPQFPIITCANDM